MRLYSIEQLDDIINRRVNKYQTWNQIAAETEFTLRELKALNHCLNTTRACKHCGRPVPINSDKDKEFCNPTCMKNQFARGAKLIELEGAFVPGFKFSLSIEQINDAVLRYSEFGDTLREIANDLGVATSTLTRTFKACGINRYEDGRKYPHFTRSFKICPICGKEFEGIKTAYLCGSASCRGKAYYRRHQAKLKEQVQ